MNAAGAHCFSPRFSRAALCFGAKTTTTTDLTTAPRRAPPRPGAPLPRWPHSHPLSSNQT